jgi:ribonuclease HI
MHSKGKWHKGQGNGEGSIFADEGRMRMESNGTTLYPICQMNRGWEEKEDAANADIVAAAPELLAACEAYVTIYGHRKDHENAHAMKLARAAVAKARGQ